MTSDIKILKGRAELKQIPDATAHWPGAPGDDGRLVFQSAYEIERTNWDKGLRNCRYRIHSRTFTDLSCMEGETLKELPNHFEVRRHDDGTKFLFAVQRIPTFDAEDRVWDGALHAILYGDAEGIHLISCRHGYSIPRIRVYIGLEKSTPTFATEWLDLLERA